MLRELNLIARTICTLIVMFALSGISGLTFGSLWWLGIQIFVSSILFQYWILYLIMKRVMKTPRGRRLFLNWCEIFCLVSVVGSSLMIPHLSEVGTYSSAEDFVQASGWWCTVFLAFGAAFVACICTRRAFIRHRAFG